MSRAWRIGTPARTIAPKFRANRAKAIFVINSPKTGNLSLMGSRRSRTEYLFLFFFHHAIEAMMITTIRGEPHFSTSDMVTSICCLLYTSDAADDLLCVDLGGRRIIK